MTDRPAPSFHVVLKGWPRLSETFIAQELKGLEDQGLSFDIWSLRRPYDRLTHPIHGDVQARVRYLPEYLHEEPLRVLRGALSSLIRVGFLPALIAWLGDLARDRSLNRVRRFGQACVLAREAAPVRLLYAHFLHTPGSVARYAAMIRGIDWGFSAHARDIWTIPDWEKREKVRHARFGVTCTDLGWRHLAALAGGRTPVDKIWHGLDLRRFPPPAEPRPPRAGRDEESAVRIVSVGRLVEKKGYRDVLAALADMPDTVHWRFEHIGGGPLQSVLSDYADRLGIGGRVRWRGPAAAGQVLALLREGDVFALGSKVAQDGDRDGLPNVLLEAASQELAIVATRAGAIPEFVAHDETGVLVPPSRPQAMAEALQRLARDPATRLRLGRAARRRLEAAFGVEAGVERVAERIRAALDAS